MAFQKNGWQPQVSMRGGPAISYYRHTGDNRAAIKAANYFNHNEVRGFILKQGVSGGAVHGIPVWIRGSDGSELIELLLDANGNVTTKAGGTYSQAFS